MKRQWLIVFTWLLVLTTPILTSADKSLAEERKPPSAPPKGSVEIIATNIPATVAGVGGLLTGVAAIITARNSRKKSKEELKDKISLSQIEENGAFRNQLLNALAQDKGEFLDFIRKLGGFTTACDVEKQFESCQKAFDDRLGKALRDNNIKNTIEDLCHFITREKFDDELKECRFINANPEARKNLIAALTLELQSPDNREKLKIIDQAEVIKEARKVSMSTVKENSDQIRGFEEKLEQITAKLNASKAIKENHRSPTTQGV